MKQRSLGGVFGFGLRVHGPLLLLLLFVLDFFSASFALAVPGACRGQPLPYGRDRRATDIKLVCTSGVDHYFRRSIPFDMDRWVDLGDSDGSEAMWRYRRETDPLIQWSGKIPYSTIETWTWYSEEYGEHPSCGSRYDEDGNFEGWETCWYEESHYEERHCSSLVFEFEAEFERPSEAEWHPGSDNYEDVIPHKYNLLPGEVEDVQTYNTTRRGTRLRPDIEVGNAWNRYRVEKTLVEGFPDYRCDPDAQYKVSFKVHTEGRIYDRPTPNAFRIKTDEDGVELNPLKMLENVHGETTWPRELELVDAADEIIAAMARQSRDEDLEREKAKKAVGLDGTTTDAEIQQIREEDEFWHKVNVRLELKEEVVGVDFQPTETVKTDGGRAAIMENYKFDLVGMHDIYVKDTFYFWESDEWFPDPDRKYVILVSMHQEGVPFYRQPDDCYFWNPECHFSKPLPIRWRTEVDLRSTWQSFQDWSANWY